MAVTLPLAPRTLVGLLALTAVVAGCRTSPSAESLPQASAVVHQRTGHTVRLRTSEADDRAAREATSALLLRPLSREDAVRVALLNNPSLQAELEAVGIARADVLQAGLLENPILAFAARIPRGGGGVNWEIDFVQSLFSILLRPARRSMAADRYHEVQAHTTRHVLGFVLEVERAWLALVGAQDRSKLQALIAEATGTAAELARRMRAAGNLSELRTAREEAMHEAALVALDWRQAEAAAAREQLRLALGLACSDAAFEVTATLPGISEETLDAAALTALAQRRRADLQAECWHARRLATALRVARATGGLHDAELGVAAERESEGGWAFGPAAALPVPLFDQGQADVARLSAALRQSRRRRQALQGAIATEVRIAVARLDALRRIVARQGSRMVPLRERIVALAQREYNFMLIGTDHLLAAKRDEFEAYDALVEVVLAYWTRRAELEHAVGGRIPGRPAIAAPLPIPDPSARPPAGAGEHVHHRMEK